MTKRRSAGDRHLAAALGLTLEELDRFQEELDRQPKVRPGVPVAGIETLLYIVVNLIIGIGFTLLASLFAKKPPGKAAQITTSNRQGETITANQRSAPQYGFDSVQEPATLGSIVPMVWANQEQLPARSNPIRPAGYYGGVRVNMPLLWSQLWSVGSGQALRAIFLLGESTIPCVDPLSFAVGDNTLGGYDLGNETLTGSNGRFTVYHNQRGGRLTNASYSYGADPSRDIGNATNDGGQDVFALISEGGVYRQDFCSVNKPSTTTTFGLGTWLPNGVALRINPTMRPTIVAQIVTQSQRDETVRVETDDDPQGAAQYWKSRYAWSYRCGVVSTSTGGNSLAAGDTFVYLLSQKTDGGLKIKMSSWNTDLPSDDPDVLETCGDVAGIVASVQQTADQALVVGDLFRAGSCIAVLESRTPGVLISDSDVGYGNPPPQFNEGSEPNSITCVFRVVRAGLISPIPIGLITGYRGNTDGRPGDNNTDLIYPPQRDQSVNPILVTNTGERYYTATSHPQLFKMAVATVKIPRACKVFELGIRSSVGLKVQGLCNFRDCPTQDKIDQNAGLRVRNKRYKANEQGPNLTIYQSGQITTTVDRYSFFRVGYRQSNQSNFTQIVDYIFGVRGTSGEAAYNYMRIEMEERLDWEIRLEPVSGWEIRNNYATGCLLILDAKLSARLTIETNTGVKITYNGFEILRQRDNFFLSNLEPKEDLGISYTDAAEQSMLDAWGKLAEVFCYQELKATVGDQYEHEIVNVNVITRNNNVPQYDGLSTVGLVLRAGPELNQLNQFSCRVIGGGTARKFLEAGAWGSTHLIPDILRMVFTNNRFGAGSSISEEQIDLDSFAAAAQWCRDRRYFWDGVVSERKNIAEWATNQASASLLELSRINGRYTLKPATAFGETVVIKGLFNEGNIVENSFILEWVDSEERAPFQMSVRWRQERAADDPLAPGDFSVQREVLVREVSCPDTAPIVSVDLSESVTNVYQAIDYACLRIRETTISDHNIKFDPMIAGMDKPIAPGDYIKVALDTLYYDDFSRGAVTEDGRLVVNRPDLMPDGSYSVIAWDGGDAGLSTVSLTVANGGTTATPTGIIFMPVSVTSDTKVYKIESITLNEGDEVGVTVEASYNPVNNGGQTLMTQNWSTYVTDANWIIEQ